MNALWPFLGVFLAAFGLGLPFLAPGLVAGDAGELVTAAYTFGIPHPPGYPLWSICAHGFCSLSLGCPAFRVSLFSLAGWAAGTAVLGALLARRWGAGLAGIAVGYGFSLFIAFTPLCLDQATGAEVYGLHYLLSALLLAFVLETSPVHYAASCFVLGLGFAHHHTMALVLPAWAWAYRKTLREPLEALRGLALAALGGSLYLLLPLRSNKHPFSDWGHPDRFISFWSHLTRRQYGGDLTWGHWWLGYGDMFVFWKNFALEGWGVSFALLLTVVWMWKRDRKPEVTLWLALLGTAVVFPWLAHTPVNPENISVIGAFFPPVLLWSAPLLLSGFKFWMEKLTRPEGRRVVVLVMVLLLVARVGFSYIQHGQSNNVTTDRMGRDFLLNLPPNSVLYSEGDTATFPLAYLQGVLGLRKDATIFDRTGGLFENLYHIAESGHSGGLKNSDLVQAEVLREGKHPGQIVFYTESEFAPGRLLAVNGLIFKAAKGDVGDRTPHGLWPHFRIPSVGDDGDYLSRETAARFYIFRAANGLRSGMAREMILEDFRKAAELGYDNIRLINNIGMEFMGAGWVDNAEKCFLRTVEIDPSFALGWYNLGVAATDKGKPVDTEARYRRCLEIDPSYTPARDGLAVVLYKTGRLEEAVQQWQELLKRDMNYPQAFRNLGMAVLQVDPTHSRLLLEQYLKMVPNAPDRGSVNGVLQNMK